MSPPKELSCQSVQACYQHCYRRASYDTAKPASRPGGWREVFAVVRGLFPRVSRSIRGCRESMTERCFYGLADSARLRESACYQMLLAF
ncbi:hypothetical protein P389DRAFT_75238 [Cystobasidium minutum MCA 4210]|uniref:uncharacterized protein n=1 Tax=Cystobasidium minutum MCA 4210 TaxID=1397322 RepID=UPI0034CE001D|eukprot:jgi/Rhomi1/75238/CE75237_11